MKTLYLIRGVSGSGKSTLAKMLSFYEIAADYYFYELNWDALGGWGSFSESSYNFDASKLSTAHAWCQQMVEWWMEECEDIAVHNTFTTEKELKPYLDLAEQFGYCVISMVVENRHGNTSIHDVPNHVLELQEARLRNSLKLR